MLSPNPPASCEADWGMPPSPLLSLPQLGGLVWVGRLAQAGLSTDALMRTAYIPGASALVQNSVAFRLQMGHPSPPPCMSWDGTMATQPDSLPQ